MSRRRMLGRLAAIGIVCVSASARGVQYFDAVGGSPLGTAAEWTNYLTLADLDGDGDLDLVVPNCGGFFSTPQSQPFHVYRNQDGAFVDATAAMLGETWTAAVRVVAVGDVDGDGDLDIYAPASDGQADRLYINDGTGVFVDQAGVRLPGAASRSAGARLGDVDGDGDLDLLVGQGYAAADMPVARLYVNDGSGMFTDATQNLPPTIAGTDPDDIDFFDVDRDFDLDVLLNAHTGPLALWRNDGAGVFTDASSGLPAPNGGPFHYGPSACDVDGDGDLDLWIDNTAPSGTEQLLINDGTGAFTDQTAGRVSQNPAADDNGVWCVDVDADGDLDAVVASLSANERVLRNDGSGNFAHEAGSFPAVSDPTLWMDFGDLDGDGRQDVVTGQGEGSPQVNRVYVGNLNQPVDTRGPRIIAAEAIAATVGEGETPIMRFAVSDSVVTDLGPRLERAFVRVTADPGNSSEIEAAFVGGDLFRAVLTAQPAGSVVQAEVCAVDRQGNDACGAPQTYMVIGADGDAGPSPDGGSSATGDGGGCGCSSPGGSAVEIGWAAILLIGVLTMSSRRATFRRPGPPPGVCSFRWGRTGEGPAYRPRRSDRVGRARRVQSVEPAAAGRMCVYPDRRHM